MFNDPGTELVLDFSVYNSADVLTDAASVVFWWKIGRLGGKNIITPTHVGTGLYQASFTPDQGGTIYYRFEATTPNFVVQDTIYVEEDVWDQSLNDYQDT
jgi:hypothetical protein